MPGPQGEARAYERQALFRLMVDGIEESRAETCSEFMNESEVIEQRTGESREVEEKLDGNVTRAPITLTRGSESADEYWYEWRQQVLTEGSRAAERNASIEKLTPDGTVVGRINLPRAWPSSYKEGGWDAKTDETLKEEITIVQTKNATRVRA